MFSPALGRVARTASSFTPAPATCRARAALQQALRRGHQRRLSSSKPSTPPNDKKKPAEIEQNATSKLQGARKRRDGAHKTVKPPSTPASATNIPMVPPTNHLREDDVKLSAFFGLHRPISIQNAFPGVVPIDQFNDIFDLYRPNDAETMQKTKTILEGFLQRMYDEIDVQEEQRADAAAHAQAQAQAQADVYHLDAPPTQQSIESWAARLAPFSPPAAPVPHDPLATEAKTESFSAYDVSASINQRITEVPLPSSQKEKPTTFRRHVARRRNGMLLISVRRQRKLKMKKHKYKKLMKRTRLLRRKLDRL